MGQGQYKIKKKISFCFLNVADLQNGSGGIEMGVGFVFNGTGRDRILVWDHQGIGFYLWEWDGTGMKIHSRVALDSEKRQAYILGRRWFGADLNPSMDMHTY